MQLISNIILISALLTIIPFLLLIIVPFILLGAIEELFTFIFNYRPRKLSQLWRWSKKPWPLHLFPIFVAIHICILRFSFVNSEMVNPYFGAAFQISGGFIILCVLNENMGIITKNSIINSISGWFKSFPFFLKPKNVSVSVDCCASVTCTAEGRVIPSFKNTEEKVDFLLKEIDRIESKIGTIKTELNTQIKYTENKFRDEMRGINSEINEINSKMKKAVVGGAKLETLGALNIAYGILIPFI